MGFADLSIHDIAAEYNLPIETVFHLCDQLQVAYRDRQTNLALEDAKAIISLILSRQSGSNPQTQDSSSENLIGGYPLTVDGKYSKTDDGR